MCKLEAGASGTMAPAPFDRARMRLYDDDAGTRHRRSNQGRRGVKAIGWTFRQVSIPASVRYLDRGLGSPPKITDQRGRNMGNIVTRFTERFGCKHPFACAGMAFAGMTHLALAVCRGGGVGAIGVGLMPAEQLRAMIHEMRKQTTAPFNVNLITFFDNDAQIRVCAEERVPVVSFHW